MRTNNVVVLFLAIVMGGIAAFMARQWLQAHADMSAAASQGASTIVVVTQPLPFGATVSADNITEIPWGAGALPDGAFASKDDILKNGRRVVLSPFNRNEPVLSSKITGPGQRGSLSSLLEEGKRAVTVRVDDVRGVAGFVLPGDFVDVVLIGEDPALQRENYSEILLHHVKVLAIDQLASERQEQPTVAKAVTVEATPEQAQRILLASNVGKLSLILRQPGDVNADSARRVTERDLGRDRPRRAAAPPPPAPPAPPPPPAAAAPPRASSTVTVSIVRGNKREDYNVRRTDE
jgi:pilus assembly protein CpaB